MFHFKKLNCKKHVSSSIALPNITEKSNIYLEVYKQSIAVIETAAMPFSGFVWPKQVKILKWRQ